MHLGVASTRLPVSCTYGLGVVRQTYNSLRRESHGDGGADTDLALQVQRTAVHFDKGLGQRQTNAGPFVLAVEPVVDLLER